MNDIPLSNFVTFFIIGLIFLLVPILVSVAFVTLMERKVLSIVGNRLGPNKVSFVGILQPMGDAVKLSGKQMNYLSNYNFLFYYLSCLILLFFSLVMWTSFFYSPSFISFKFSLILLFLVLSFNSFSSILSGWSTFSKYSLIGSIRTVAQLISYESALYFSIFSIIVSYYSFSYEALCFNVMEFSFMLLIPFFYVWIPSFLAELNRTPYDFSEGESELVSGFNTEFGSVGFTFLFLSEYSNIIFFSLLSSLIFFSGGALFFFFLAVFFIIWIRAVLPRYRFDKLMLLAWKFFIPFLTFCFLCMILMS